MQINLQLAAQQSLVNYYISLTNLKIDNTTVYKI